MGKEGVKTIEELIGAYESKLTTENLALVRRYFSNINEEPFGSIAVSTMMQSEGKPLSNSFFLHELKEIEEFANRGHDFVDVESPDESFRKKWNQLYEADRTPHLNAILYEAEYLRLKAVEAGFDLSLGATLKHSPLISEEDYSEILTIQPDLASTETEDTLALTFFIQLAEDEQNIFKAPFKLSNKKEYYGVSRTEKQ